MANTTCISVCLAVLALTAALAAERIRVESLGEPPFADRETSATFALPQAQERNWRLEISAACEQGVRVEAA